MPRIAFIGVRISWLMLARKSLLAWFATSARSLASSSCAVRSRTARSSSSRWRRRSSSACLRSWVDWSSASAMALTRVASRPSSSSVPTLQRAPKSPEEMRSTIRSISTIGRLTMRLSSRKVTAYRSTITVAISAVMVPRARWMACSATARVNTTSTRPTSCGVPPLGV